MVSLLNAVAAARARVAWTWAAARSAVRRWMRSPLLRLAIQRLLATAALPNVRVGIIPFDCEATAVYANAFAIFEVPGAPVVLVENYTNEVFLHEKRDIGAYSAIFARLEGSALFDEAAADFAMGMNGQTPWPRVAA